MDIVEARMEFNDMLQSCSYTYVGQICKTKVFSKRQMPWKRTHRKHYHYVILPSEKQQYKLAPKSEIFLAHSQCLQQDIERKP
jgi:hypothetical protein